MKTLGIAALAGAVVLVFLGSAMAAGATTASAEIVEACNSFNRVFVDREPAPPRAEVMRAGMCLGFVKAAASTVRLGMDRAKKKPCRKPQSSSHMVAIAHEKLLSQPERWREPPMKLVVEAFTEFFTCGQAK